MKHMLRGAKGIPRRSGALELLLGGAVLLLSGCTIVEVNGASRVSGHLGVLRIEPSPGAGLVAYRTSGLGLVPGPAGATLGFSKAEVAFAYDPSRCQAVVFDWPRNPDRLALIVEQLKQVPDVCRVGGESK
jgi:hypothetical protein